MVTLYPRPILREKELDGKEGNIAASQGALKDVIQVAEIPTLALDQRCELYDETYR